MRNPTTTSDHWARQPSTSLRGTDIRSFLGWTAVLAAMLLIGSGLDQPRYVDRIRIENPTRFDISIDVTDQGRNGWTPVGTTRRGSTTSVENVIDQGDVWIVRFTAQGEDGGELRLTRRDLAGDRWRFRIPDDVNDRLLANGASFPP